MSAAALTNEEAPTEAEEPVPEAQEQEQQEQYCINRIFMNHVDCFNARHIAAYLTDQNYGALRAAAEEQVGEGGEEEEPTPGVVEVKPHERARLYEVIGTTLEHAPKLTEDIKEKVEEDDAEVFKSKLLNCGFVIYDITQDPGEIPKALAALSMLEAEIEQVKEIGPKTFAKLDVLRVFILISTCMTWANTKPIDPDDPNMPFNESDYRKRKSHPNFAEHIACEKEVIMKGKKYKDKLRTYVLCCGILYGYEEEDFMFLFKMAWYNEKYMPIFKPGTNKVPLIHVYDLAKIIHAVIETLPKKPQYILCVEQSPCTLSKIVNALAKIMGRKRVREVEKEAAFLYKNMTQSLYDRYTVNISMEPGFIVDDLEIEFKDDLNMAQNMKKIVAEFRNALNLIPFKIILHGPPAVGKTLLAKRICEVYGLKYISVPVMIQETVQEWTELIDEEIAKKKAKEEKIKNMTPEEEDEAPGEAEEEEEEDNTLQELTEKLRDLQNTIDKSENGRIPDDYVIRLMKETLRSNMCQNQGYVLDGYPKNMEQVKELFGMEFGGAGGGEEGGEDEEGGDEPPGGVPGKYTILPNFVISLEASDEFLCERVMNRPEKEVQGTHYTEEHMLRRLKEFRMNNTANNTILNFFDEHEIHPIFVDAMADPSPDMDAIFKGLQKLHLGRPIGFPYTLEEKLEIERCRLEAERLREEEEKLQQEILERQALEEYQLKMEEKIQMLSQLQLEEEKYLAAKCEPLRRYLMQFIFPTLTEGLLEVAHVKPHDPVDYLAEYLFKANPEGKMFDPAYTRQGELIENVITQSSIQYSGDALEEVE